MEISVESLKRVEVVTVAGRVDSSNYDQLDKQLEDLMSAGRHSLVMEMSGVEYISSAGLRALVGAYRTCRRHGGTLVISNPSKRVAEVLDLAGLDTLFQVYGDTTSAVGSF